MTQYISGGEGTWHHKVLLASLERDFGTNCNRVSTAINEGGRCLQRTLLLGLESSFCYELVPRQRELPPDS